MESGNSKAIGGRPKVLSDNLLKRFEKDVLKNNSLAQLARDHNISKSTAYRMRKKLLNNKKAQK
ncbi:hypothetical protein ACFQ02_03335 [Seminibacterium arietis]|uniref:Resolvase HTH domain-containing protein n=1 Tax=Seminibacterium arietis TaxID=1173502 RepID=A0ABW3I8Y9_9PAST